MQGGDRSSGSKVAPGTCPEKRELLNFPVKVVLAKIKMHKSFGRNGVVWVSICPPRPPAAPPKWVPVPAYAQGRQKWPGSRRAGHSPESCTPTILHRGLHRIQALVTYRTRVITVSIVTYSTRYCTAGITAFTRWLYTAHRPASSHTQHMMLHPFTRSAATSVWPSFSAMQSGCSLPCPCPSWSHHSLRGAPPPPLLHLHRRPHRRDARFSKRF